MSLRVEDNVYEDLFSRGGSHNCIVISVQSWFMVGPSLNVFAIHKV